jgi:hypothetical protein
MKKALVAMMLLALAPVAQALHTTGKLNWIAAARCASKLNHCCGQE